MHETYGFALAVFTYAIVFGAFCGNVLYGAMRAVPRAQLETAEAYGMTRRQIFWRILVPQMWIYALPGPVEHMDDPDQGHARCCSFWGSRTSSTGRGNWAARAPRPSSIRIPDWRFWYFLGLLIFYLAFTRVSEIVLARLTARLSHGQATAAGEELRKAAA